MSKKRILWIDYARGIAIIAMVVGHSLGTYWPGFAVNFIFAVHMPIFFVLSGYLYHEKNFKKTFFGGINNLLVPYITTVIIEAVLVYLAHKFNSPLVIPRFTSVHELFYNAVYGVGIQPKMPFPTTLSWIGAIWFLLAMFFGTMIFHAVMRLHFKNYDLQTKILILLSIATIGAAIAAYITLPLSLNAAMFSQVFLLSGYLIKRYHLIKAINKWLFILFFGIWVLTANLGIFFLDLTTSPNLFVSTFGAIAASLVIFKICIFFEQCSMPIFIKSFLSFCGAQSLLILCFHLIDLDNIQFWNQIVASITRGTSNYLFAIVMGIVYRLFFACSIAFVIKYIPLLRSLYSNRNFPLFIQ